MEASAPRPVRTAAERLELFVLTLVILVSLRLSLVALRGRRACSDVAVVRTSELLLVLIMRSRCFTSPPRARARELRTFARVYVRTKINIGSGVLAPNALISVCAYTMKIALKGEQAVIFTGLNQN